MKLLRNSWHVVKASSLALSVFTMVLAPVGQGIAATNAASPPIKVYVDYSKYKWNVDKQTVQQYLKVTGLATKKKMTVGEFYQKMRPYYPKTLRREMDRWATINRNELMPEVEVSTYKDTAGKEQIRFMFSKNGQSATVSFNPGSKDKYVKFNNTYLAKTDMLYHEQAVRKIGTEDKMANKQVQSSAQVDILKAPIRLSYEEFTRLTPVQRAEYMIRLRKLAESAEAVFKTFYGEQAYQQFKHEFYVRYLLGLEKAEAARASLKPKTGDPCIVSGYISQYGEGMSCGGKNLGRKDLIDQMHKYGGGKCPNNTISCNPLVYGFNTSGNAFCIKNVRSDIIEATSKGCAKASPLQSPQDKKRIIESYLASKNTEVKLEFGSDGKVAKEQYDLVSSYLKELNEYVDQAINTCKNEPLASIAAARTEQATACKAIALRKINLEFADLVAAKGPLDCSKIVGSVPNEAGDACVCPEGTTEDTIKDNDVETRACVSAAAAAIMQEDNTKCLADEKRDEKTGACVALCGWWCGNKGWLLGLGALGLIGGLFWWMNNKDDDSNSTTNPQTPVDPCATATSPLPATCLPAPVAVAAPPPVLPPPIPVVTPTPAPAASPTPVVVPSPIPTTTVESTNNGAGASGAGVR